jgi:hypothetical protein
MKSGVAASIIAFAFALIHLPCHAQDVQLAAGSEVPLQGSCADNGMAGDNRGASSGISTWSCAGSASSMMNLTFADGSYDHCVYIDNTDPEKHAYFVPMKTMQEWLAFKGNTLAGGTLYNKIRVTYGCEATSVSDECNTKQNLPRARSGTDVSVKTGNKVTHYSCTATTTCGVWAVSGSAGNCPVNGVCGNANNVPSIEAPTDLCQSGTPSSVTRSSQWDWECKGSDGGKDIDCHAPIQTDGECGGANGGSFSTAPSSGLCVDDEGASGVVESLNAYVWSCTGQNGGAVTQCNAKRVAPDATVPPVNGGAKN